MAAVRVVRKGAAVVVVPAAEAPAEAAEAAGEVWASLSMAPVCPGAGER